jgi:hypothetical protein
MLMVYLEQRRREFGFTVENIVNQALKLVEKNQHG